MNAIDWLLFGGYVALVVYAWNISVNPTGRSAQQVQAALEKYGKVPARFEKKRDKRSG